MDNIRQSFVLCCKSETTLFLLKPDSPMTPLCSEIMRIHCQCVLQKAESLARTSRFADAFDYEFLREAVMLHDYGIIGVHVPDIGCFGTEPYIMHGILGAQHLRNLNPVRYARHARVCERHIGSGLTAEEIQNASLPLPARDFLPETLEEKLITYADNFFSKNPNHLTEEKSWDYVLNGMKRFGSGPVERLLDLRAMFEPQV